MLSAAISPTAIAALRRLADAEVVPDILDAQVLAAAGLLTQDRGGPIRPTERGLAVLGSAAGDCQAASARDRRATG